MAGSVYNMEECRTAGQGLTPDTDSTQTGSPRIHFP